MTRMSSLFIFFLLFFCNSISFAYWQIPLQDLDQLIWKSRGNMQTQASNLAGDFVTPTRLLTAAEIPSINDDLFLMGLDKAIERQLTRFNERDMNGTIQLGGQRYPLEKMRYSLLLFRGAITSAKACLITTSQNICWSEFANYVKENFNFYGPDLTPEDPRYNEPDPAFFTGYYSPFLEVKSRPSKEFPFGIFGMPKDPLLAQTSREEIDFGHALDKTSPPLLYAKNLFELYLLQVQGSGLVQIIDQPGKPVRFLNYDGTNQKKFAFISLYMKEKGYISDLSVDSQRSFLAQNPGKQREIFSQCPGYVFFKLTDVPPVGSDLVSVTPNRSIATDNRHYRMKGLLSFVQTQRPNSAQPPIGFRDFSRFFLDQDTGGAIKGKARADIYFGEDQYAETAAYNMQQRGNLYFLMAK